MTDFLLTVKGVRLQADGKAGAAILDQQAFCTEADAPARAEELTTAGLKDLEKVARLRLEVSLKPTAENGPKGRGLRGTFTAADAAAKSKLMAQQCADQILKTPPEIPVANAAQRAISAGSQAVAALDTVADWGQPAVAVIQAAVTPNGAGGFDVQALGGLLKKGLGFITELIEKNPELVKLAEDAVEGVAAKIVK